MEDLGSPLEEGPWRTLKDLWRTLEDFGGPLGGGPRRASGVGDLRWRGPARGEDWPRLLEDRGTGGHLRTHPLGDSWIGGLLDRGTGLEPAESLNHNDPPSVFSCDPTLKKGHCYFQRLQPSLQNMPRILRVSSILLRANLHHYWTVEAVLEPL